MRKIAGLVIVIMLASLFAMAQMPGMGDPPRGPHFERFWANPMIVSQLGLTDAQIKQFDQLAIDTGTKLVDDKAAADKLKLQIMSLFIPDKLDEAKLNQQVDALLAAETRAKKTVVAAVLQGFNLLTPEQQKKAKTLLSNPMFMRHLTGGMVMGMGGGIGMGNGMRAMPRPAQPTRPPQPQAPPPQE